MASVKNLAHYIYENQKRGFSDIEIYQILEQSGWSKNDIDYAFKKANLIKSIDLIMSVPFKYLKKWPDSIKRFLVLFSSKILQSLKSIILNFTKAVISFCLLTIDKTTSFIKGVFRHIFVAIPHNMALKLLAKKKQKIQNKSSAIELSKYIEKNLEDDALENDIFIELLKTGWNPKISNI